MEIVEITLHPVKNETGAVIDLFKVATHLKKDTIVITDLLLLPNITDFIVNIVAIDSKGWAVDWVKSESYNAKYLGVLKLGGKVIDPQYYTHIGKKIKLHTVDGVITGWSIHIVKLRHIQIKLGKNVKYYREDFFNTQRAFWAGRKNRIGCSESNSYREITST